jgi:hypothetical protein
MHLENVGRILANCNDSSSEDCHPWRRLCSTESDHCCCCWNADSQLKEIPDSLLATGVGRGPFKPSTLLECTRLLGCLRRKIRGTKAMEAAQSVGYLH